MVEYLTWFLLAVILITALPLQLLGLPGTWLIAAGALLFRWLHGPGLIDYHNLLILFLMALLAELGEFLTAVKGARSGAPVKGAVAASIVGAFAGGILGAPILFGLGALPGMAAGAWVAVFLLALARGTPPGEALRTAYGAMTGRIKGTAVKMIIAVAMLAVTITTLIL